MADGHCETQPAGLYFGDSWHAPMLDDMRQVAAPIGQTCSHCDEPIKLGQQGLLRPHYGANAVATMRAVHRECDLRAVVGGINHQRGECTCHGGHLDPDPEWATRREAALMATYYFEGVHARGVRREVPNS